jgi:lipid-A-disaccharide synthase
MTPKRFMIIAGETSGDMLAAELVAELRAAMHWQTTYTTDLQPLRSDLAPRFFGAGGPRMADAGVEMAFDLTRHSLTGIPSIGKFLEFRRLFFQLFDLAVERQPHAIICVDFNLFNLRFAAHVKQYVLERKGTFNNWDPKIIKYISPQVWASRENRARQMARDFDLLLAIFPFEKDWYAARVPRLPVEFVGHPMIDRYRGSEWVERNADSPSNAGSEPLVLLLPGSRPGELKRHLPVMLGALEIIRASNPRIRARMVLSAPSLAEQARTHSLPPGLEVRIGGLPESLAQADIALASTGTVTMECAYFGVPTVTLYKTSWSTYEIAKRIVKVKSLTMPNLLAGEAVFPEFIQNAAMPMNIANAALDLLRNASRRQKVQARLKEIIASLGPPGASRRAAEAILKLVP